MKKDNTKGSLTSSITYETLETFVRIKAQEYLQDIIMEEVDIFLGRGKYDAKATEKLLKDWDRMVAFYSFPKEQWVHLRTTNVVESPFSTVRLRTDAAKRFKKVENTTAMIWKLLQVAEKNFRTLKAYWLLPDVYAGKMFVNGVLVEEKKKVGRKAA